METCRGRQVQGRWKLFQLDDRCLVRGVSLSRVSTHSWSGEF
jgi:hypothetical protein